MKNILIIVLSFISINAYGNNYFVPNDNKIIFDIMRKEKIIGSHNIIFTQEDNILNVSTEVDIKIKLGFITLYKYTHRNKEKWRNNELISISTNSVTNSKKKYSLNGKQQDNKFVFSGIDGKININKDIIPISYWNIALLTKEEFLDSQKGIIRKFKNGKIKNEELVFNNKRISTNKYGLYILTEHPSDEKSFPIIYIWYTDEGELIKLQFDSPEDNSIIEYIRK